MQKNFYFLLTLLWLVTGQATYAQTVFAPHGAEWWYIWEGLIIPPNPYTHARVVGDTVVGGQVARKLLVEDLWDDGSGNGYRVHETHTYFVRTSGDDVLRWDPSSNTYHLEYRFNRAVGATWSMPACQAGNTIDFVVDSTISMTLGNAAVRLQYSSVVGPSGGQYAAIERVGSTGGISGPLMFPHAYCGLGPAEAAARLVSYTDSTVQFGSSPLLHRPDLLPLAHIVIGPNPSSNGHFKVDGITTETIRYEIMDALGHRYGRGRLTAAFTEIDLSTRPAGLYLLRGDFQGRVFTRRLVRE